MEAVSSSETSVDIQQTTWLYIPEDSTLISCVLKLNPPDSVRDERHVSHCTSPKRLVHDYMAVNILTIYKNVLTEIVFKISCLLNNFMVNYLSGYPVQTIYVYTILYLYSVDFSLSHDLCYLYTYTS
jgi:hypothetical protein